MCPSKFILCFVFLKSGHGVGCWASTPVTPSKHGNQIVLKGEGCGWAGKTLQSQAFGVKWNWITELEESELLHSNRESKQRNVQQLTKPQQNYFHFTATLVLLERRSRKSWGPACWEKVTAAGFGVFKLCFLLSGRAAVSQCIPLKTHVENQTELWENTWASFSCADFLNSWLCIRTKPTLWGVRGANTMRKSFSLFLPGGICCRLPINTGRREFLSRWIISKLLTEDFPIFYKKSPK